MRGRAGIVLTALAVLVVPCATPSAAQMRASAAGEALRDTVLALRPGDRVAFVGLNGSLTVEAVDGDRIEVAGDGGGRLVRVGADRVEWAGERGTVREQVTLKVRLPAWADLEVQGMMLDVTVRGTRGRVDVNTVVGRTVIERTSGDVDVRTASGILRASDVQGAISLSSHADDVIVWGATGRMVDARSLAGDVVLEAVDAERVHAETQAGDIRFQGAVRPGGRYAFLMHAGDARIELPRNPSATVRVSTFSGSFSSDFPAVVPGFRSGRTFSFGIGGGEADVRIEVFDGEIRLVRGP